MIGFLGLIVVFLGLDAEEGVSFYDFLVWYVDRHAGCLSLDYKKGKYALSAEKAAAGSPLPLVRVLMQQSGCFRIVDRNAGLDATVREQELKDKGVLRADDTTVRKGRGIVAQYSVQPSLTFSEQDAAVFRALPIPAAAQGRVLRVDGKA